MFKIDLRHSIHFAPFVMALTLAGCGAKEQPNANTSQPAQVEQSASKQANLATSSPVAAGVSAPAIATADGETPGVRAEVQELKRSGDNTLTLRFTVVNDSDKKLEFGYDFGDEANHIKDYNSIGGVNLIDSANKKKYFVVRDTESNCVCSRNLNAIPPKSRSNLWAKFPAPPADVQKISVVIPHFGPLDDVPISQ